MKPETADSDTRVRAFVLRPIVDVAHRSKFPPRDPDLGLDEATSLALALDLNVVRAETVRVNKRRAATFLGLGKVAELAEAISGDDIELLIFDGTLSPVQQRNLEKQLACKVLDRTALILEIFGARARTREGVLQVELAHLTYQKSRLVRSWTHLERQRGGVGFLGGPGETQIESDRRALEEKIVRIRGALEKVRQTRAQHAQSRRRSDTPVVALVGYTNAGKSTLFNRLTSAGVLSKDMLFATLDTTMRAAELPDGKSFILSDTVGFVANLPTQLVAAFRGTLEEVLEADLILHVRDVSHPESGHQAENVNGILADLGLGSKFETQIIEVWNKFDLVPADIRVNIEARSRTSEGGIPVSATTGQGIDDLLRAIETALSETEVEETIALGVEDGQSRAWLFQHARVLSEESDGESTRLRVSWTLQEKNRFANSGLG